MTPSPAASHIERTQSIEIPVAGELVAGTLARVLVGRNWPRVRFIVDFVVLYLASSAALFAAPIHSGGASRLLAACFPLITLVMLNARRNPDERLNGSSLDTALHVLGVVSLAAMLTIAAGSILGGSHPVGLALRLWVFAFVYLSVARMVLLSIRKQTVTNAAFATPTLVVGAGVVGGQLVRRLVGDPGYGLRPVGFLDADPLLEPDRSKSGAVPVLGGLDDLPTAIVQTGARHVILAFSSEPDHVLVDAVKQCQQLGVEVSLVPRLYELVNERATLDHVGGLPVLALRPTNPRGWQFALKHAFDRSFAFAALLALAPVMLVVAIGVKLSSPGPVLFRQRRVGRDGRVFDLLKFRTMRASGDLEQFEPPEGCAPGGVEGQDRRTGYGRFLRESSLDELPQLINVVFGQMSLIGPRPERPEFVARFIRDVIRYDDRHRVKSGITGWAQVNGFRGQTSIIDRVEWDNYYIQNWSLWLDLRIIALTLAELFRLRG